MYNIYIYIYRGLTRFWPYLMLAAAHGHTNVYLFTSTVAAISISGLLAPRGWGVLPPDDDDMLSPTGYPPPNTAADMAHSTQSTQPARTATPRYPLPLSLDGLLMPRILFHRRALGQLPVRSCLHDCAIFGGAICV